MKRNYLYISVFILLVSCSFYLKFFADETKFSGKVKVWVFFKDKGINTKENMADYFKNNNSYVSEKSKQRRRNKNLPEYRYLDLPVSKKYISILESKGYRVERISKWLNAVSIYVEKDDVEKLSQLSFVKSISPVSSIKKKKDFLVKDAVKSKSFKNIKTDDVYNYGDYSYNQIKMLNINTLHNKGYTGKDVVIALFDTGVLMLRDSSLVIDSSSIPFETTYVYSCKPIHRALKDVKIITSYDFIENKDFAGIVYGGSPDEINQLSHGTKMLGLMASYYSGELISPAFGASYIIAKTEIADSEIVSEEDNWIAAIEWADSLGADIISSSVGYKDWYPYSVMTGDSTKISKAANIAADSFGILVVNAIGNLQNVGIDRSDTSIIAPADAYSVLTVGGVDDSMVYSQYSVTGPTYDVYLDSTIERYKPEVVALAEWPYTVSDSSNSFNYILGTSGSTALVSAGCALVLQAHPDWTPAKVKEALTKTAKKPFASLIPDTTYFSEYPNQVVGYGVPDFYRAVMYSDTEDVYEINSSRLLPPYPNPYSLKTGTLKIPFEIKRKISNLMLYIYTLDGKLVYYADKENVLPGVYDKGFEWNGVPNLNGAILNANIGSSGNKVSPGIYLVILQTGFEKSTKKITIIP
ncbi:MAG: S8 family serine peptidase [candidate division WOR-3 bacterium]